MRHGAKVKIKVCSKEGCANQAVRGGVCIRHGASWTKKQCSSDGCTNKVQIGGVCIRHGAKVRRCSYEVCTNVVVKGGVCRRHGAYRNTNDESTAFGSLFEQPTATQSQSNQHASEASITGRDGESVPGEVSILCQEIYEV